MHIHTLLSITGFIEIDIEKYFNIAATEQDQCPTTGEFSRAVCSFPTTMSCAVGEKEPCTMQIAQGRLYNHKV